METLFKLADASRPFVAIFGGDERVHAFEDENDDARLDIRSYCAHDTNAVRLATAIRQGSFSHVILLTRWQGHAQYNSIKAAVENSPTGCKLILWPRGLGALEKALPKLVGLEDGEEEEVEEEPEPPPPSVHILARNHGVTVACYQERHTDCAYHGREHEKLKCGCACHPRLEVQEPTPPPPAPPEVVTEPPTPPPPELATNASDASFNCSQERVLEVLGLDPTHEWTGYDVAAMMDAKTPQQRSRVHGTITRLIELGEIEVVYAGTPNSRADPRRVRLMSAAQPEEETKTTMETTPTTPAEPATPPPPSPYAASPTKYGPLRHTAEAVYVVVDREGFYLERADGNIFWPKQEALALLSENEGATMHKLQPAKVKAVYVEVE